MDEGQEVSSQIVSNVGAAVAAVKDEPAAVKAAVGAAAAAAAVPTPTSEQAGWLWRMLVGGLMIILITALIGIIITVQDGKNSTSPDVLVTVFSSSLTGLIGLFVRPSSG